MSSPKVSVILPIYNVEEYLEECLETVTRQTLSDIEIICVNDGSKDGSLNIINKYAENDARIVVLDGPNGGYGKAMNKGLDRATGEYIGIVEPDDFIALTMYEDLYEIAIQNKLDFVKADFYRFRRSSNGDMRLKYYHLDKTDEWYGKVFSPSENPYALMFIMNTWSGIYSLDFLKNKGIRHHETPGASFQDNGFWFQTFVYAERAMIVPKPYYRNRRDNPNSSVKDSGKVYCMNEEYDYIESLLRPNKELWDRFKSMFWLRRYHNYRFTHRRIDEAFREEYLIRFSDEYKQALESGELDQQVFADFEWEDLMRIINDPRKFHKEFEQELAIKRAKAAKKRTGKEEPSSFKNNRLRSKLKKCLKRTSK